MIKTKISLSAWTLLRNERVKEIKKDPTLHNIKYLRGPGDSNIDNEWFYYDEDYVNTGLSYEKHIGKYLSYKHLESTFRDGLYFKQPSLWKDNFESRFYEADFSRIVPIEKKDEFTPRLYACCFTYGFETEAAWNTYMNPKENPEKHANDTIRLEIKREKLLCELNKWAEQNKYLVYVGYVNYKYPLHLLKTIHLSIERENALWFENFSLANFLSLLLQKREAYDNEREERFFIIPQGGGKRMENSCYVKTDISRLVDKIILGPNFPDAKRGELEQLCHSYGLDCKIVKSELNTPKPDAGERLLIESVSDTNPWSIKNVKQ